MINLIINYEKDRTIELDMEDYLYFTGGNHSLKQKIILSLKRFAKGKTLSALEENIYGENGIEIIFNNRNLRAKDITLIRIKGYETILNEILLNKKSLVYDEILQLKNDIDVSKQIENINNELLLLELLISQKKEEFSENMEYKFKEINFDEILNRYLKLIYFDKGNEVPIQYMNPNHLINEFVYLIYNYIVRSGNRVWIIFDSPYNYYEFRVFNELLDNLRMISNETKLLNTFIFNTYPLNHQHNFELEKTVLLYSSYQQLPSLDTFRQSIERHYPERYPYSDQELVESFFRVCHLFGTDLSTKNLVMSSDMVLLTILKELIGDEQRIETSNHDLSLFERNYLLDKM